MDGMKHYLFIGGPYHDTFQEVECGMLIWNLPDPQRYPVPCSLLPPEEIKFTVHTYRRVGLNYKDKFIGYVFAEMCLANEEVCDLFLELKRKIV